MTIGKSRKKLKKLIHGKANVLAEVGEYDNATDVVGHDVNGKGGFGPGLLGDRSLASRLS